MQKLTDQVLEEIAEEKKDLYRDIVLTTLTLVGLVVGVIAQIMDWPVWSIWILFGGAYLAGGLPATVDALIALKNKKLDINLLMVAAALAAAAVGEVRDGAILLFLFSLAGTLEAFAMGSTKKAIVALLELRPDEANLVLKDGQTKKVSTVSLQKNDLVVVRPGERIPIDGEITEGAGAVDQAAITGESLPVDKNPQDMVFAGTINQNAVLTIRVTAVAADSTLARMIDLAIEAQEKKAPSERFSNWFGQRYTIIVLSGSVASLFIFLFVGFPLAEAMYKSATLLVVASPCAIVISVPAAILSALAVAARNGVLFKGGAALENFANIKTFAFDKTGTITTGKMSVTDVVPLNNFVKEDVLSVAYALESHSDHPLARSVVEYAKDNNISAVKVEEATAKPGSGVVGTIAGIEYFAGNRLLADLYGSHITPDIATTLQSLEMAGKTVVMIGRETELVGFLGISDTPRTNAKEALAKLKQKGVLDFILLSGDTELVVKAIGAGLGLPVEAARGSLLPEDKVRLIKEKQQTGRVAFVGDGVNDAAALATADIGIAMGVAGSDVAIESADVALLSDDLSRLAYAYNLSNKANRIIKQNLIFAIGIMSVMIIITTFWYLPLPLGVLGHEGGTILVVANGLRLLFSKSGV